MPITPVELQGAFDCGLSWGAIAKQHHVSFKTISKLIAEHDLKQPEKGAWNKGLTKHDHPGVMRMSLGRIGLSSESARLAASKRHMGNKYRYKRGWNLDARGYVEISIGKGKKVRAHRHCAEQLLGRKLGRLEDVHHMDEVKRNNDPHNLIVLPRRCHIGLHAVMDANPSINQLDWLKANKLEYIWLGDYVGAAHSVS